jgi:hypothetical protein
VCTTAKPKVSIDTINNRGKAAQKRVGGCKVEQHATESHKQAWKHRRNREENMQYKKHTHTPPTLLTQIDDINDRTS